MLGIYNTGFNQLVIVLQLHLRNPIEICMFWSVFILRRDLSRDHIEHVHDVRWLSNAAAIQMLPTFSGFMMLSLTISLSIGVIIIN